MKRGMCKLSVSMHRHRQFFALSACAFFPEPVIYDSNWSDTLIPAQHLFQHSSSTNSNPGYIIKLYTSYKTLPTKSPLSKRPVGPRGNWVWNIKRLSWRCAILDQNSRGVLLNLPVILNEQTPRHDFCWTVALLDSRVPDSIGTKGMYSITCYIIH